MTSESLKSEHHADQETMTGSASFSPMNTQSTSIDPLLKDSKSTSDLTTLGKRSPKYALAPMVRIGSLPMRLLSLSYGADEVYSPELVDKSLMTCKRIINSKLGCVDYIREHDNHLVLRTVPSLEKNHLRVQLGSSCPETALTAALKVRDDCSGIDLNCGCPKAFSLQGGMGAALLRQPKTLLAILHRLAHSEELNLSISCKIRLLYKEVSHDTMPLNGNQQQSQDKSKQCNSTETVDSDCCEFKDSTDRDDSSIGTTTQTVDTACSATDNEVKNNTAVASSSPSTKQAIEHRQQWEFPVDLQATLSLCRSILSVGGRLDRLAIHGRTPKEDTKQSAHWDCLYWLACKLKQEFPDKQIYLNGDFLDAKSIETFQKENMCDGLLLEDQLNLLSMKDSKDSLTSIIGSDSLPRDQLNLLSINDSSDLQASMKSSDSTNTAYDSSNAMIDNKRQSSLSVPDGFLLARGPMLNASIFAVLKGKQSELTTLHELSVEFLKLAIQYELGMALSKFTLLSMWPASGRIGQMVLHAKSMEQLCLAFDESIIVQKDGNTLTVKAQTEHTDDKQSTAQQTSIEHSNTQQSNVSQSISDKLDYVPDISRHFGGHLPAQCIIEA